MNKFWIHALSLLTAVLLVSLAGPAAAQANDQTATPVSAETVGGTPVWQPSPQAGCQSGDGDDPQLGWWLLAMGLVLMSRALREDDAADLRDP